MTPSIPFIVFQGHYLGYEEYEVRFPAATRRDRVTGGLQDKTGETNA